MMCWKMLFLRMLKICCGGVIVVSAFFVEVLILTFQITAVSICCSGILCLGGLIVPYVRNNWIQVDIVTSFWVKLLIVFIIGMLMVIIGYLLSKWLLILNIRFCKSVVQILKRTGRKLS